MTMAMVCEYDCLTLVSVKNKLVKICEEFSRIDFKDYLIISWL